VIHFEQYELLCQIILRFCMSSDLYPGFRQVKPPGWWVIRFVVVLAIIPVVMGCAAQPMTSAADPPATTESPPASVEPPTETLIPASPTSEASTATESPDPPGATPQTDTAIPPTNVVTPEVIPPDDLMTPDAERYSVAVTYTLDSDFPEEYPQPEAGEKWLVVVATLTNVSSAAITLERESLILVDEDGTQYQPEIPDEFMTPPLVGATVAANTSHIGLLRYSLPQTVEPTEIIWCLSYENDTCVNSVSTVIP
jgi:hypothetical protein